MPFYLTKPITNLHDQDVFWIEKVQLPNELEHHNGFHGEIDIVFDEILDQNITCNFKHNFYYLIKFRK